MQQPTLYISSSEAALHTTDVGLQRRETQCPAYVYNCNNLHYTFLPARLLCTPQMLDYEGGKHIAPHTADATAYVVLFFQRGCCAHPQILNYECGKHIAPHIYTNATAYAVLFFQWGYSAHPQILNYEGRKNTAPHTYSAEAAYAVHFFQRGCCTQPHMLDYEGGKHIAPPHIYCWSSLHCTFLLARLLSTPTDSRLRREETYSPPTHILLKQAVLYISCCTFLQQGYCAHP